MAGSSTTDYNMLRQELQDRPTLWGRQAQMWRIEIYLLFEEPRSSMGAQVLSVVMLGMILTSIVCFMIETMPELKDVPKNVWLTIEICCTAIFTIEYVTRLVVCDVSGMTRMEFIKSTMNVVDLLAILPFYIWLAMRSFSVAKALGVLRTVRLVRLFRIFKLGRYSLGLQLMAEALKNSSQALWVLSFFLAIGILLFSSAVYYVEKMACPDSDDLKAIKIANSTQSEWDLYVAHCRVSNDGKHPEHGLCCDDHGSPLDFPSIIEAFWWSTVTMTTVGFGDVYPRTEPGRFVACGTMLSGILLIALPVAIIGRKFQEVYEEKELRSNYGDDSDQLDPQSPLQTERTQGSFQGGESPPSTPNSASLDKRPTQELAMASEKTTKAADGPTLIEMSRRLRLMKMPDSNMTQLAMGLADDLEEVGEVQQEIKSMSYEERTRQVEVVDLFDGYLKRLTQVLDPEAESRKQAKATMAASLFKNPRGGLGNMMVRAARRKSEPTEVPKPGAGLHIIGEASGSGSSSDGTPMKATGSKPKEGLSQPPPLPPPSDDPPPEEHATVSPARGKTVDLFKKSGTSDAGQALSAPLPPGMVESPKSMHTMS
jgi:hypothetical protein